MTATSTARWARRAVVTCGVAALLAMAAPPVATAAPGPPAHERAAADAATDRKARADAAAARKARADAAAARARQRAVEAAQRARVSWDGHGRPHKLIIVRPASVDSVTSGVLTRRVTRTGTAVTLARLDAAVPSDWITTTDRVTRLSAAIVLTPGVSLDIGGDVTTLALAGGATASDASSIYTGGGTLTLHDISVTSVDPVSGRPLTAGPGRPFVVASAGGHLDATGVTFSDLGTPADDPQDKAGVGFGSGSTGSLVRTTVQRTSTGVRLNGSAGVRLDALTVVDSAADGLVLQGDEGTTLVGVRAERNGGNGVQVSGRSTERPITGITTTGNRKFGLAVINQMAPHVTDVTTRADGIGGLQLAGDAGTVVTRYTAVDEPIGVLTHLNSRKVTLNGLRIDGGGRGLVMEKTTDGLVLSASTVERTQTGVSIGGHDIELRDVSVGESRSGVRVERGARVVTTTGLHVTGGQDGVVVLPGTTDVTLRDTVIDGVANVGVRTAGPGVRILGGRIAEAVTGIDAGAATTVHGTEITRVDVGLRVRSTGRVAADDVGVSAVTAGVVVAPGSPFVLTDSRIDALEAVSGPADLQGVNRLSLPPVNVLGAIGLPLVVVALLLDQVQRFRQRGERRGPRRAPPSLPAA